MQYRNLGNTNLEVSPLCLGTMTFGQQNSESDAHAQLDYAVEQGINFIDTAEMYPVPPFKETQGLTEQYIGTWLSKRNDRDQLLIASKVTGRSDGSMDHIRNGPRLNRQQIEAALDASLKRLQTDYIDLYQVHWPERKTNFFGKLGYRHSDQTDLVPIAETLTVLTDLVKKGKIRHIGISNETPWGVMQYLNTSEKLGLPRITSIQNPYNLLNRTYEVGMAEISHRERIGLLAYSPLCFGFLTGKYYKGQTPPNARLTLWKRFARYSSANSEHAMNAYVELARQHDISVAQMALSYVNMQPFVNSTIIGATTMEQLRENIDSLNIRLSNEVLQGIEAIHTRYPNSAP